MSYCNEPICDANQFMKGNNENIVPSCSQQHAVLVDLLMRKELKRNGLSPHAVPFYPMIDNINIRDVRGDSKDSNEDNKIQTPGETINNKPNAQEKKQLMQMKQISRCGLKTDEFFKKCADQIEISIRTMQPRLKKLQIEMTYQMRSTIKSVNIITMQ